MFDPRLRVPDLFVEHALKVLRSFFTLVKEVFVCLFVCLFQTT